MTVLFLLFILFVIGSARFPAGERFHRDYMSRQKTLQVKGIFVVLVFLSHYAGYIKHPTAWDRLYLQFNRSFGQMIVAMFLFYSGYGVMESIQSRGKGYVRFLPRKRILPVWFRFAGAVLIYLALAAFYGKFYSPLRIFQALIGWESVGNSCWYIFTILMLYLLTFFAFLLPFGRREQALALTLMTIAMAAAEVLAGRPTYFYSTCLLYPFGAWFSLLRDPAEAWIMKKQSRYFPLLCGTWTVFLILTWIRRQRGPAVYFIWETAFVIGVVLLTMKISFRNVVLEWFGRNVFGIYIFQRFPMIILRHEGMIAAHPFMSLLIALTAACAMAVIYEKGIENFCKKRGCRIS